MGLDRGGEVAAAHGRECQPPSPGLLPELAADVILVDLADTRTQRLINFRGRRFGRRSRRLADTHLQPSEPQAPGILTPKTLFLDRGDWAGRFPDDGVGIRTQAAHYAGMPAPDHHQVGV